MYTRIEGGVGASGASRLVGNDELAMYSSSRRSRKPIERKKWWREVNDRVEKRGMGVEGREARQQEKGGGNRKGIEREEGIRGPFVRLDVGSYLLYRESNKWPRPFFSSSNVVSPPRLSVGRGNSFPLPRCD